MRLKLKTMMKLKLKLKLPLGNIWLMYSNALDLSIVESGKMCDEENVKSDDSSRWI
jgi:hypothetical protein